MGLLSYSPKLQDAGSHFLPPGTLSGLGKWSASCFSLVLQTLLSILLSPPTAWSLFNIRLWSENPVLLLQNHPQSPQSPTIKSRSLSLDDERPWSWGRRGAGALLPLMSQVVGLPRGNTLHALRPCSLPFQSHPETEQLSPGHNSKFPEKRMYDPIWSSYLLLGHPAGTRDEDQVGTSLHGEVAILDPLCRWALLQHSLPTIRNSCGLEGTGSGASMFITLSTQVLEPFWRWENDLLKKVENDTSHVNCRHGLMWNHPLHRACL